VEKPGRLVLPSGALSVGQPLFAPAVLQLPAPRLVGVTAELEQLHLRQDVLLEKASCRQLNLREALTWLCGAELASKERRRLSMAMSLARFPFVRANGWRGLSARRNRQSTRPGSGN
jgi:hypothetical protein